MLKNCPRDKEQLTRAVEKLCKCAPLKEVALMFGSRDYGRRGKEEEYWRSVGTVEVGHIKSKYQIEDHPESVTIVNEYVPPPDLPKLAQQCRFSDYHNAGPHRKWRF